MKTPASYSTSKVLSDGAKAASLLAAAWAFSVLAADHVMAPHAAAARAKVAIMCALAEYQAAATEKQCAALGTSCPRPPSISSAVIVEACADH